MAWSRPTIAAILDRVSTGVGTYLDVVSPVLERSLARVVSVVIAGASHMLHAHIDYGIRQIHPATQDEEHLLKDAAFYGMYPNAATFATGTLDLTGTNGGTVPDATIFTREDGAEFITSGAAVIAGGVATVTVDAVVAGSNGNFDTGGELTLGSPIVDVDSLATVAAPGISGGSEKEELEDFRIRFQLFMSATLLGGSDADYILWAKTITGVTRVWVYRHENGLGTVYVRFLRDGDLDPIPDSGEVAAVQTKLDSERPTTAEVTALAPVASPIDFTLSITPDTPAKRTAVENEITDLFFRSAAPGDVNDIERGVISLAQMRTAVGIASPNYELTSPSSSFVPTTGQIATVGTFTWPT